jgi:hypothetical protein
VNENDKKREGKGKTKGKRKKEVKNFWGGEGVEKKDKS